MEDDALTAAPEDPTKACILVVEDDEETRGLISAALEEHGYEVEAVGLAVKRIMRPGAGEST